MATSDKFDVLPAPLDNSVPPTITREEALSVLNQLDEGRLEQAAVDGKKTTYIKELVNKLHPFWWKNMLEDLNSPDKDVRKSAMIEFNKLQCRVLPNEIGQSADSDAITLNIKQFIKPATDAETD